MSLSRYRSLTLSGIVVVAVAACDKSPVDPPFVPGPGSLTLSAESLDFDRIGDQAELSATVYDTEGNVMSDAEISWTSLAPQVAEVDGGTVTSLAVGTARIVASHGEVADTAIVTSRETIDSSGGTIETADGSVTLNVPAGAVPDGTSIGVEPLDEADIPAGSGVPGTVFRFSPAGIQFDEPVTLEIDLSTVDLSGNMALSRLVWHGGADVDGWEVMSGGEIDLDGEVARISLESFSVYGLGFGPGWAQVVTANQHACALDEDGSAFCWGNNAAGRLGIDDATVTWSSVPLAVAGGHTFEILESSEARTCGITSAGRTYCWGASGGYFALGDGANESRGTPTEVAGGHAFTTLSLGMFTTCGRTSGGDWYCWGLNSVNQLLTEPTAECFNGQFWCNPTPVRLETGDLSFAAVDVGWQTACGLTSGGSVYCWGGNAYGEAGIGRRNAPGEVLTEPTAVVGGHTFRSIHSSLALTCGIDTDGASWCWGWDWGFGSTGTGTGNRGEYLFEPTRVSTTTSFERLETSRDNSIFMPACGITAAGTLECWGPDWQSALFAATANESCTWQQGSIPCATVPVQTAPGHAFEQVSVSTSRICAVRADGEVWCWGLNTGGALGRGVGINDAETGEPGRILYPWEAGDRGTADDSGALRLSPSARQLMPSRP